MEKDRKLIRKRDALIIALLIIPAALYAFLRETAEKSGTAVIYSEGDVIDRVSLDKSGRYEYPELPDVVFTVENGSIRISENNCGDLTCVRSGAASRKGEAIICMPKKIAVEIESVDGGNAVTDVVIG